MEKPVLEIKNLKTYFDIDEDINKAVDGVNISVKPRQTVCIVGESGCGKSVTALSVMGLISQPGRIVEGEILLEGKDLRTFGKEEMRSIRGKDVAMIFQEPMTALNPVFTIGEQMIEPIMEHSLIDRREAYQKAVELIQKVGIPRAESILHAYPHELSGGMLQRIMIAIALSCGPKLLIADEPTTALDVTIQAQILDLLRAVRDEFNMSILFITHDLGIVAEMADYVVVMYAGKVVEEAPVDELFRNPKHPYTRGLLESKPVIGQRKRRLYSIPGQVLKFTDMGNFCYFSQRCGDCFDICKRQMPRLEPDITGHKTACWLHGEGVVS